ncbi:hypothetical protein STANM309S_05103 [Streptomyces tanashiensis]
MTYTPPEPSTLRHWVSAPTSLPVTSVAPSLSSPLVES